MILGFSNEFIISLFNYFVIGWFLLYIILLIILYIKSFKPYKTEFNEEFLTHIPNDINIIELSHLINRKINANALSAYIIKLINDDKLRIENVRGKESIIRGKYRGPVSIGDEATIKLLLSTMGDGEIVSIEQLYSFCNRKRNNDILLMEYKIWCKIMVKENYKHIYFETKELYGMVKVISIIGCFIFSLDIIINIGNFMGYFTMIFSVILLIIFSKIYKRTKDANEEYKKWIAFRSYLENINNFNIKIENPNKIIEYGNCLGVKGLEHKLTNHTYYERITEAINKSIIKAILNGNRSL